MYTVGRQKCLSYSFKVYLKSINPCQTQKTGSFNLKTWCMASHSALLLQTLQMNTPSIYYLEEWSQFFRILQNAYCTVSRMFQQGFRSLFELSANLFSVNPTYWLGLCHHVTFVQLADASIQSDSQFVTVYMCMYSMYCMDWDLNS